MLILANPVAFNQYVQPACISKSLPNLNSPAYTSGWGYLQEGGVIPPSKLHNVKLFYYPETYCQNVYPSIDKNWKSQICAGFLTGDKDTCQGT